MLTYLKRILISIDQMANVIFGPLINWATKVKGFGLPDETLSSVMGKYTTSCRFCAFICMLLDKVDHGHCKESIEPDEGMFGNEAADPGAKDTKQ